jgi:DNA-binding transcriptional LysR family regulator
VNCATKPSSLNLDLIDLRKLRYFVEVAENLHFGRAAEHLYVAQPALSRQIRKLEESLGVELFIRSSRKVELTAAGRSLLKDGKSLLAATVATRDRTRGIAQDGNTLTVGFSLGDPVVKVACAFARIRHDVTINPVRVYWADQTDALVTGRVDVTFARFPITAEGVTFRPLFASPRVALLPGGHPLAGCTEVSIMDLADEPVVRHRGATEEWERHHNCDPRPNGARSKPGPYADNVEEILGLVGIGRAISFLPASAAATLSLLPEVIPVAVSDAPPTQIGLAWRMRSERDSIQGFVKACESVNAEASEPTTPSLCLRPEGTT